jgi:hypothetical protein
MVYGMFGVIGGSVEIGGEGFTLYFSSSSLSVVLSLCFPMHTHTHTQYTVYTNSLFLLSPSIHSSTPSQDSFKFTALIWAAIKGYVEAVKALVAADPDLAHLNMKVSVP